MPNNILLQSVMHAAGKQFKSMVWIKQEIERKLHCNMQWYKDENNK